MTLSYDTSVYCYFTSLREKCQYFYEWGRAVGNATLTVQNADVGFAQNEVEHNDSKWKEINIKKVMKKIK